MQGFIAFFYRHNFHLSFNRQLAAELQQFSMTICQTVFAFQSVKTKFIGRTFKHRNFNYNPCIIISLPVFSLAFVPFDFLNHYFHFNFLSLG